METRAYLKDKGLKALKKAKDLEALIIAAGGKYKKVDAKTYVLKK